MHTIMVRVRYYDTWLVNTRAPLNQAHFALFHLYSILVFIPSIYSQLYM